MLKNFQFYAVVIVTLFVAIGFADQTSAQPVSKIVGQNACMSEGKQLNSKLSIDLTQLKQHLKTSEEMLAEVQIMQNCAQAGQVYLSGKCVSVEVFRGDQGPRGPKGPPGRCIRRSSSSSGGGGDGGGSFSYNDNDGDGRYSPASGDTRGYDGDSSNDARQDE